MSTIYCGCDFEAGYRCTRHARVAANQIEIEATQLVVDDEADVNDYKGTTAPLGTHSEDKKYFTEPALLSPDRRYENYPKIVGTCTDGLGNAVTFPAGTVITGGHFVPSEKPPSPLMTGAAESSTWYCGVRISDQVEKIAAIPNPFAGIGGAPTRATTLPTEGAARKQFPVASGVLDYFPDALAVIANVSWQGNEQHNPGQPLHWARGKSGDESDTMIRHFLQRGSLDTDGIRHTAKMAWRALAILQKELEQEKGQ